jgi:hypothetical protein
MPAMESWSSCIDWFEQLANDTAYAWAAFFPDLLRALALRASTSGLYAHRWATTLVVSRFGAHPDWQVGPKVELTPLPDGRVEVMVYDAYNQKRTRVTLRSSQAADLDEWMTFVAGE